MTNLRKRAGALALALSMCASLVFGSVPALAAEEETTYKRPELVMDFLGDNKTAYSDGVPGTGTLPPPEDEDMALKPDETDDGNKWNRYVDGDQGGGGQTIFWIGIGIRDMDRFILSNDGKGLYSAELALYYNPDYVEPYVPAGADESFETCMAAYNLGDEDDQKWSSAYSLVKALTAQDPPLNDPNDSKAVGDPTTPEQGYGSEEFSSADGWKMAYFSVEKTSDGDARFNGTYGADTTYYIARIPFVLKGYDPNNELCIRLARNASVFSIGSAEADGVGGFGDGAATYGNWDKYTYHDPQHDLKLMFDYTGDLNIFTNTRDRIDEQKATLTVENNSQSADNYAQLIINGEPLPKPSQIAYGNGIDAPTGHDEILRLSGGEQLRVSAHKGTGFTVTVTAKRIDNGAVLPLTALKLDGEPEDTWTDEWTFIVPTGPDVIVTVIFTGEADLNTPYKATLVLPASGYDEPDNTAQLTIPGGVTTQVLTPDLAAEVSDELEATANTVVTVAVTRNSDYDVVVKYIPNNGSSSVLSPTVSSDTALSYTFEMPVGGVKIEVTYELATKYKATLALAGAAESSTDPAGAKNTAQLSYVDGDGNSQTSAVVTGLNKQETYNADTGLYNNQIATRSGRVVTVQTSCDPEYQVKQVLVHRNGLATQTVTVTRSTSNPNLYYFTMPAYDVDVTVSYEKVKTYKVKLITVGADGARSETATLSGVDARNDTTTPKHYVTLDHDNVWQAGTNTSPSPIIEVFSNAKMNVVVNGNGLNGGLAGGRTATVDIYYPVNVSDPEAPPAPDDPTAPHFAYTDVINAEGSSGSGFTFNMVPMDDAVNDMVVVVVRFADANAQPLIARIREDRGGSISAANAQALWDGLGHSSDITTYEGTKLTVDIALQPGYYISNIQVRDEDGTYGSLKEVGAPLGVPVTLSGIGYNNGEGGTVTASFVMPSVNSTLFIQYEEVTNDVPQPPKEPEFTAAIRKYITQDDEENLTLGGGTLSIKNETTGVGSSAIDTNTDGNGAWVDAQAGDMITATYSPDKDSFVAGVTAEADVPGTAVSWRYNADGSVSVTMPAANVVVTVKFLKLIPDDPDPEPLPDIALTVAKTPETEDGNTVSTTTSAGTGVVVTDASQATAAKEGEQVVLKIHVEPGFYIDSVELNDGTNTSTVPVSGTGYHDGNGGDEIAQFIMPGTASTVTVNFTGETTPGHGPDNKATLVVTEEPAGGGSTANLIYITTQGAEEGTPVSQTVPAGQTVRVELHPAEGYVVDMPVLTTPTGLVDLTWTDVDAFEFTMPEDPITVTVPYIQGTQAAQFHADLIFRGDPEAVAKAKGTFLTAPVDENYKDQLYTTLRYSRLAQAGESVPFAVQAPVGYYISEISVTPDAFGVTPTITGMIGALTDSDDGLDGAQRGEFRMPAGNVILNITLAEGWPDEVEYPVTLHVTAPGGSGTATLANTVSGETTGPVPDSSQDSQSKSLTALDGNKLRVILEPASGHVLDSVTITDGSGRPVSYQWTTDSDKLAVEFAVPGSSVDVYVVYKEDDSGGAEHTVTLHLAAPNGETAVLTGAGGGTASIDEAFFSAAAGEDITLAVGPNDVASLITAAYAIDSDGKLVTLVPSGAGDPAVLAGAFVKDIKGSYSFIMPFDVDVDVYLAFDGSVTPPEPTDNKHTLTLQVTGPKNSGNVQVREYKPTDATNAVNYMAALPTGSAAINGYAMGSTAMLVNDGDVITAEVHAASGYALYSLIAYTASGERVVVSLYDKDTTWNTYAFTMPADTTHIEAEFRAVKAKDYQIQVVVNNTVNGGKAKNDAFLYQPPESPDGFKFKSGVSAGEIFELGLQVASGYQVDSILAVPQGSGVAANIPLPATNTDRTEIRMPASDLVIYVTFKIDSVTRYTVIGQISYPEHDPAIDPPATDSNTLLITGSTATDPKQDTAISNSTTSYNASIKEAKGEKVTAVWTPAAGYAVSSYTVTTSTGQPVLSEPLPDGSGILVIMPASPILIDVVFTKTDVEPPKAFTATLHYVYADNNDGTDVASITDHADSGNTTNVDNTSIALKGKADLHVGSQVDISATPGADRYIQAIYVLQNGPEDVQKGQLLPLAVSDIHKTIASIESTGSFYMPSGDVDVYVVFTATQPKEDEHRAMVKVNGVVGSGSAEIAAGTANATAQAGKGPAGIVAMQNATVTVTITVDPDYEIESVTGTPITLPPPLVLMPDSSPVEYTFVMPAGDVSIVVNLKEKTAAKYQLNLHVGIEKGDPATDPGNVTKVAYGSPQVVDYKEVAGNTTATNYPKMQVPGGKTVTLTVTPAAGYFVRAAYVVYNNELVLLTPVELAADYAGKRSAVGLEGATAGDAGLDPAVNTATFVMPKGTTDVYIVYERGEVPEEMWYNVVVMATDTGGASTNMAHNEVQVSSAVIDALDPVGAKSVFSDDKTATSFYSVPLNEQIHIDATGWVKGYQFDTMSLSAQDAVVAGSMPSLTDPATPHPLGAIKEFTMPAGNIGVHINFKAAGATGLTATLHIVAPKDTPGYSADKTGPYVNVTLSVGEDDSYRYVDNSKFTGTVETDNVLTELISTDLITATVDETDPKTRVVQVVITSVDEDGNAIGSVLGTHYSGSQTSQVNQYTYIMGDKDVHVYVVLAAENDKDRFIAAATPAYLGDVTANGSQNVITAVTNITTTEGMENKDFWTEVRAKDQVKVDFKAESGVYVSVSAVRAGASTALPVAQFGVGDGSAGSAYVEVPDPGCDVTIVVTFSNEKPTDVYDLSFISHGHAGQEKNEAELWEKEEAGSYATLSAPLTPTSGKTDDLIWPSGGTVSKTPGTGLKVTAGLAEGYVVESVDVTVTTKAGALTVQMSVTNGANAGDPKQLLLSMPVGVTKIKVNYKTGSMRPYDPDNENAEDDKYADHWIKAENRGDYLIVTVPMLNSEDGNSPTDVVWKAEELKNTFRFYLKEDGKDASTPIYTSLMDIIELTRPDDAPDAETGDPDEYWLREGYCTYKTNKYDSAQFKLTVKDEETLDKITDDDAKAEAKRLAAILRQIMDNDGTKSDGDKYSLYITSVETTYVDKTPQKPTESEYVDFEVPQYYALTGRLESWAPTHIATFTLAGTEKDDPVFVTEFKGDSGTDLWWQEFTVKLTSDYKNKLKDKTFTLTIEKAGHITYTHTEIKLDTDTANYREKDLAFFFTDPISLICGDVDNSGDVGSRDVDLICALLYDKSIWTTETDRTKTGWADSIHNPETIAYAIDLNGDGGITTRDLDIMLYEPNYNHTAEDYGDPKGLNYTATALFALTKTPEWAKELLAAGREIPDWAAMWLEAGMDVPEWSVAFIQTETAIPNWAMARLTEGMDVPDWTVELLRDDSGAMPDWAAAVLSTGEDIPAWAAAQITANHVVPDWAVALIQAGEALPEDMQALADAGEPLPETLSEPEVIPPQQVLPPEPEVLVSGDGTLPGEELPSEEVTPPTQEAETPENGETGEGQDASTVVTNKTDEDSAGETPSVPDQEPEQPGQVPVSDEDFQDQETTDVPTSEEGTGTAPEKEEVPAPGQKTDESPEDEQPGETEGNSDPEQAEETPPDDTSEDSSGEDKKDPEPQPLDESDLPGECGGEGNLSKEASQPSKLEPALKTERQTDSLDSVDDSEALAAPDTGQEDSRPQSE